MAGSAFRLGQQLLYLIYSLFVPPVNYIVIPTLYIKPAGLILCLMYLLSPNYQGHSLLISSILCGVIAGPAFQSSVACSELNPPKLNPPLTLLYAYKPYAFISRVKVLQIFFKSTARLFLIVLLAKCSYVINHTLS